MLALDREDSWKLSMRPGGSGQPAPEERYKPSPQPSMRILIRLRAYVLVLLTSMPPIVQYWYCRE